MVAWVVGVDDGDGFGGGIGGGCVCGDGGCRCC